MTINVFQPTLGDEEIEALTATIRSNWHGKGKRVEQFTDAWAKHLAVPTANLRATTSATEGLFTALKVLGVKAGDEVILPAVSFVGAANAVAACGAWPVFCDVDGRTLNPRGEHVAPHVRHNTKAVIVLHYGGVPADLEDIMYAITNRNQWPRIVEDCAIAPLSTYREQACGTWGDVGIWSFDAMKMLSAGDGGMVYFDDPVLAERYGRETHLGLTEESGLASSKPNWWEFGVNCYGHKATMNDLTASILLEQLKKAETFLARRRSIWQRYDQELGDLPWLCRPPTPPGHVRSSYSFYWIQLEQRDALAHYLRQRGVYTSFRYWPLNRLKIYGTQPICPNAERAAATTLLLPLHQGLSDSDVGRVVTLVRNFGRTL